MSVVYGVFVLGSRFSGGWYREAFDNIRAGTKPDNLKVGSWVQAAWPYGAPSWFFWGLLAGVLVFLAMSVRMTVAVAPAQALARRP